MLGRTRRAPLLISRRAHLYNLCAPSDAELPDESLDASIVKRPGSPRCHCNSRFSNVTSPNAFGEFHRMSIGMQSAICNARSWLASIQDCADLAHRQQLLRARVQRNSNDTAVPLAPASSASTLLSRGHAQADIVHGALSCRSVVFLIHVCRLQVSLSRQRMLLLSMCLGSSTLLM